MVFFFINLQYIWKSAEVLVFAVCPAPLTELPTPTVGVDGIWPSSCWAATDRALAVNSPSWSPRVGLWITATQCCFPEQLINPCSRGGDQQESGWTGGNYCRHLNSLVRILVQTKQAAAQLFSYLCEQDPDGDLGFWFQLQLGANKWRS